MNGVSEGDPAAVIDIRAEKQMRQLSELRSRTREYRNDLRELSSAGRDTGEVLGRAFMGAALRGKDLSSTFKSMILSLSERGLKQASGAFGNAIASGLGNMFSGMIGNANGNAFADGRVIPMARGGITSGPTLFPLSGGRTGLMGEAGAEAVMPLARGPDGRLGVRSGGGAGVTVNFNVSTPDVGGFRRSESQIAAMLSRVAGRGGRNQ